MIETRKTPEAGETPEQITISMIDQDLKDGISKPEMAIKYGIKPWEVDEMFKHPLLKGRRPSRKKKLSFNFVDDLSDPETKASITEAEYRDDNSNTDDSTEVITDDNGIQTNPNQVTLEQAIDEAIGTVEDVKDQMQQTQEAITEMLSPSDPTETVEELINGITGIPNGDTMSDTDDDDELDNTVANVIDILEEEIEIDNKDDDSFEL